MFFRTLVGSGKSQGCNSKTPQGTSTSGIFSQGGVFWENQIASHPWQSDIKIKKSLNI